MLDRRGIRVLMLESVACGNTKDSPFLHGTLGLPRVLKIIEERRHIYTNWLVRWPLDEKGDAVINLSNREHQQAWLREEDGDTDLVMEWVAYCRKYAAKDQEVVQLRKPDWRKTQWWDEEVKAWQPLGNRVWTPPTPTAISQPPKKAAPKLLRGSVGAALSQKGEGLTQEGGGPPAAKQPKLDEIVREEKARLSEESNGGRKGRGHQQQSDRSAPRGDPTSAREGPSKPLRRQASPRGPSKGRAFGPAPETPNPRRAS